MKTCTLQEQNVKPDVQVGVAEIYRAVETSYDAVICVATQRFPHPLPPPTPLARQTNNTNLKNDDSDDENFTAKMYSRSFQT